MKYLIITVLLMGSMSAQSYQPTWESIDKRPTPAWFGDAKFGIFIHWGHIFGAGLRSSPAREACLLGVVLECDDPR